MITLIKNKNKNKTVIPLILACVILFGIGTAFDAAQSANNAKATLAIAQAKVISDKKATIQAVADKKAAAKATQDKINAAAEAAQAKVVAENT